MNNFETISIPRAAVILKKIIFILSIQDNKSLTFLCFVLKLNLSKVIKLLKYTYCDVSSSYFAFQKYYKFLKIILLLNKE